MYEMRRRVGHFVNADYGLYLPFQFNPTEIAIDKKTTYSIEAIPGLDQNAVIWTSGGTFTIDFEISFDGRAVNPIRSNKHRRRRNPFSAFTQFYFGAKGENLPNLLRLVPGGNQILSRINKMKQLRGIPLGKHKAIYEDTDRYENLDSYPYDEELGVLPHIAILEAFLRPKNLNLAGEAENFHSLGSMEAKLKKAKLLNEKGSSNRFVAPPDLYFYYGPRLFKCKLQSAPITETIHNTHLVPTRFTTTVSLIVLEMSAVFEREDLKRSVLAMSFNNRTPRGDLSTYEAKL